MFDAAKKFVVLKNLKISVNESKSMDTFEDNVLKIKYLEVHRDPEVSTNVNIRNGQIIEDKEISAIDESFNEVSRNINMDEMKASWARTHSFF